MRKKIVLALVIFSLLVLGFVLGNDRKRETVARAAVVDLGLTFVQSEDVLTEKTPKNVTENPGIAYEQVLLPYDVTTNTLYLSQSRGNEEWVGGLSSLRDNYVLYAKQDAYWEQKQAAIVENHVFTLWMVGESDYYEVNLVVTGTPVISILTESVEEQEKGDYEKDPDKFAYGSETLYHGEIMVFNPDIGTDRYEIVQAGVTYHEKGNSSKIFEKKGYALDLTDYKRQNVDIALLGMRADNEWKLNALNTDKNRIREKAAAEVWEQFAAKAPELREDGARMEYVELILDNSYEGIYCLVEPVDAKKLALDKNDVLYKVIGWEAPTLEEIQVSVDNGWKVQNPIRIRYPKVIADYEAAWYPMMDYLGEFYYNTDLQLEHAASIVNADNLADVFMLIMVTSASDNYFKNLYFAARVDAAGKYVMYQIPWDLDYTFGNSFMPYVENNTVFNPDYTVVDSETALPRLKLENPEQFGTAFLERWKSYRQDFLQTDKVIALLEDNKEYLSETGAILREQARWPEAGVNLDIDELLVYQQNRMEWLDSFFEEWVK